MLELADRLLPLLAAGTRVAVATSIDVIGSSPHLAGTSMAVAETGEVLGSVSGGCVEDAALRDCRALLADRAARVRRFGFGDAAAARAGLACGGELDVLVHLLDPGVADEFRNAADGRPAVVAVVTAGPQGTIGRAVTPSTVAALAAEVPGATASLLRAVLEGRRDAGTGAPAEVVCDGTILRLFVDVAAPQRRMVIGGATETAVALAAAATAGRVPRARVQPAAGVSAVRALPRRGRRRRAGGRGDPGRRAHAARRRVPARTRRGPRPARARLRARGVRRLRGGHRLTRRRPAAPRPPRRARGARGGARPVEDADRARRRGQDPRLSSPSRSSPRCSRCAAVSTPAPLRAGEGPIHRAARDPLNPPPVRTTPDGRLLRTP